MSPTNKLPSRTLIFKPILTLLILFFLQVVHSKGHAASLYNTLLHIVDYNAQYKPEAVYAKEAPTFALQAHLRESEPVVSTIKALNYPGRFVMVFHDAHLKRLSLRPCYKSDNLAEPPVYPESSITLLLDSPVDQLQEELGSRNLISLIVNKACKLAGLLTTLVTETAGTNGTGHSQSGCQNSKEGHSQESDSSDEPSPTESGFFSLGDHGGNGNGNGNGNGDKHPDFGYTTEVEIGQITQEIVDEFVEAVRNNQDEQIQRLIKEYGWMLFFYKSSSGETAVQVALDTSNVQLLLSLMLNCPDSHRDNLLSTKSLCDLTVQEVIVDELPNPDIMNSGVCMLFQDNGMLSTQNPFLSGDGQESTCDQIAQEPCTIFQQPAGADHFAPAINPHQPQYQYQYQVEPEQSPMEESHSENSPPAQEQGVQIVQPAQSGQWAGGMLNSQSDTSDTEEDVDVESYSPPGPERPNRKRKAIGRSSDDDRAYRNRLERMRRGELNNSFENLGKTMSLAPRTPKGKILQSAQQVIKDLQSQERQQKNTKKELKKRHSELVRKIRELKRTHP